MFYVIVIAMIYIGILLAIAKINKARGVVVTQQIYKRLHVLDPESRVPGIALESSHVLYLMITLFSLVVGWWLGDIVNEYHTTHGTQGMSVLVLGMIVSLIAIVQSLAQSIENNKLFKELRHINKNDINEHFVTYHAGLIAQVVSLCAKHTRYNVFLFSLAGLYFSRFYNEYETLPSPALLSATALVILLAVELFVNRSRLIKLETGILPKMVDAQALAIRFVEK